MFDRGTPEIKFSSYRNVLDKALTIFSQRCSLAVSTARGADRSLTMRVLLDMGKTRYNITVTGNLAANGMLDIVLSVPEPMLEDHIGSIMEVKNHIAYALRTAARSDIEFQRRGAF